MPLLVLAFVIIYSLSVGFFASFAVLKRTAVGHRYFLYHGLGAAVLILVPLAIIRPPTGGLPWFACGLCCVLFALFEHKNRGVGHSLLAIGIFCGLIPMFAMDAQRSMAMVTGAALLGFSMGSMLLGHWYLSVPGLSIDELKRSTYGYYAALGARTVVATLGTVPALTRQDSAIGFLFSTTDGLFLTMRWVWGILAPIALAYFLWDTVRLRATRSATGILYVVVVMVLIGETIAFYLRSKGILS